MKNKLEEPPKVFTAREVDEARKEGYKIAEELYSKQNMAIKINKIKEIIFNHDFFCCNYFGGCDDEQCDKKQLLEHLEKLNG